MRIKTIIFFILSVLVAHEATIPAQETSKLPVTLTVMPDSAAHKKKMLVFSGQAEWVLRQEHPHSRWAEAEIEGLALDCVDLSQELLNYVSTLDQVRWLEFSCIAAEAKLRQGMYAPLFKMTQLTHLEVLYDDRLTPDDLDFLKHLPNLRGLSITPSPFPLSKWNVLAHNINLKKLWINELAGEGVDLQDIPTTRCQFTDLHLGRIPDNIGLKQLLGKQPLLRNLSISRDSLSQQNLLYLQSLPSLETLRVGLGAPKQ